VVGAMAEPGVGKSRLFFEFKAKNQSDWMVLEAFPVSHGKASAYLPLLDLLHSYFDLKYEGRRPQTQREGGGEDYPCRSYSRRRPAVPIRAAGNRRRRGCARADGCTGQKAPYPRCDQAHPAMRITQSASDRDLRGPALDRRRNS